MTLQHDKLKNGQNSIERDPSLLVAASRSHHHPTALCVVCALNALTESFYCLIDNQKEIQDLRPAEHYPEYSDNWTYSAFISATDSSLYYLVNNLLVTESSEFEAYLSVARNMLERLSKIKYILDNPTEIDRASDDLKRTVEDVTLLFECEKPAATAAEMKSAKFLGKGINLSHIGQDKYQLLFAYLSRMAHTYNIDVLLTPVYDRFLVKAYVLVSLTELYNTVLSKCSYLGRKSIDLHTELLVLFNDFWTTKGVTHETLIYCTTYYDNRRSSLETNALNDYFSRLDRVFQLFDSNPNYLVLPRFEIK